MEACKLGSSFGEIHTPRSRLRSNALNRRQTVGTLPTCCLSRRHTCPKLRHVHKMSSFVPSVGHLVASPRCVLEGDSATKLTKTAMQVLDSEAVSEGIEAKLFEAVRDDLKLNSFTLSAYDTAWVARIPHDEIDGPLYPQALEWVSSNQRPDGSWGTESSNTSSSFEVILSTLACLLSLKTWKSAPECRLRGEEFLQGALTSMKDDELTLVSPGKFHALAELLDEASRLDMPLPYSSSIVAHLRTKHGQLVDSLRAKDDLIKTCPSRLLSFPECLQQVICWKDISELQSIEGDLFSSPAATACLFIKTRNSKALSYVNGLLDKFGSAVPSMYPKRVSHVLSLVDHLERLNVDRHFHREIYEVLDTLGSEWDLKNDGDTEDMVSEVLTFRALRQHGYDVLPDTSSFSKCCNASPEVTRLGANCMLELYRASELKFPGEEILDYAKDKSTTYLTTLLSQPPENDHSDLTEEIKYVLDFPYFMGNRPVESMSYMDRFQFKYETMEAYVERGFSRNTQAVNLRLVAFAKSNFNSCQALYQKELESLERWQEECRFKEVSFIRHPLYPSYLTAVGFASAPELALARVSWTMTSILTTAMDDLFDETSDLPELRLFVECIRRWDLSFVESCSESLKIIARSIINSVDTLREEASKVQGRNLTQFIRRMWLHLVRSILTEAEWAASGHIPSSDEYMETSWVSFALGAIVPTAVFFLEAFISDKDLESQEYWDIFRSTSTLGRLLNDCRTYQRETRSGIVSAITVLLRDRPELTEEQAMRVINDMMKESESAVLSKILNPSYSLAPVKSGWLGMLRALYMMYYKNVDGFTNTPAELKRKVERFFFRPI